MSLASALGGMTVLRRRLPFGRFKPPILAIDEPTLGTLPPLEWIDRIDAWRTRGDLFGIAYGIIADAPEIGQFWHALDETRRAGLMHGTRVDVHCLSLAKSGWSEVVVTFIGGCLPETPDLDALDTLFAASGAVQLSQFEHQSFHGRLSMMARLPDRAFPRRDWHVCAWYA